MSATFATLLFIAGDPSGDMHAAPIIHKLRKDCPKVRFTGVGGPAMEAAGFVPLLPFAPFNKMGFIEVVRHLPFFLGAQKKLVAFIKQEKPSALICIDYPGFNIPMAQKAHACGIPVIWYIAPQVWAWKAKRADVLANISNFIGVVFPFEVPFFSKGSAQCEFVGHPLIEALNHQQAPSLPQNARDPHVSGEWNIALVPGSRHQEIEANIDAMIQAALLFKHAYPKATITISSYAGLPSEVISSHIVDPGITITSKPLCELLAQSDMALVTSGTATLETALCHVPLVVVYKTSALTFAIMKRLIKIRMIGLPNIVAGKRIVPEAIQADANPKTLCQYLLNIAQDATYRQEILKELSVLGEKLGSLSPSLVLAEKIRTIAKL